MLRISTTTKITPEDAITQAVNFFGPNGQGLKIKDQSPTSALFEAGGGYVEVTACTDESETSIELVTQEWEYQVNQFIGKIPHSAKKKTKKNN
jgi:hypothetical protein